MRLTSIFWSVMTIISFVVISISGTSKAFAAQYFVSVAGDQTNPKNICRVVHVGLNSSTDKTTNDITCAYVSANEFMPAVVRKAQDSHQYLNHISIRQVGKEFKVVVYNWSREDESDFTSTTWNITPDKWQLGLYNRMQHLAQFDANRALVKQTFLDNGLVESKKVTKTRGGNYHEAKTGRLLSFLEAYKIFLQESPRQREYAQAGIEIAATLGIGMIFYVNNDTNLEDQDFTLFDGLKKKYSGVQMRNDDNAVDTNMQHTLAGELYYLGARSNGYTSLESFLITFASSAIWETMEWKEVFSKNDMYLTSVGGFAIGEAAFQIARLLRSRNSKLARALGYIVNPIQGLESLAQEYLTNKNLQPSDNFTFEGFQKAGFSFGEILDKSMLLSFESKVIPLEEWGKPGKSREIYYDTAMAQLDAKISSSFMEMVARVVFAAYYEKSKNAKGDGYEFLVGPSTSMVYRSQDDVADTHDYIGKVTLFGPIAHVELTKGKVRFNFEVEVSPAYAIVRSLVIDDLIAETGSEGLKSTLTKRGYYFGYGAVARAEATVSFNDILELGGAYSQESYDSIEGDDRFQEQVTRDYNHVDSAKLRVWWLKFNLSKNWFIQYREESWDRDSRIEHLYMRHASEKIRMATIHYLFK